MTIAHKLMFLYLIPFFICYSILSAKPVQYQVENGAGFVATTLYIPASKQAHHQGYLFSESDMNQCLAWGEETKMWRKKATDIVQIEQNQDSGKYIVAVIYFALGVAVGGVIVWGVK